MTVTTNHVLAGLCIIAAGALALARIDGWGWFLFAALLIY